MRTGIWLIMRAMSVNGPVFIIIIIIYYAKAAYNKDTHKST